MGKVPTQSSGDRDLVPTAALREDAAERVFDTPVWMPPPRRHGGLHVARDVAPDSVPALERGPRALVRVAEQPVGRHAAPRLVPEQSRPTHDRLDGTATALTAAPAPAPVVPAPRRTPVERGRWRTPVVQPLAPAVERARWTGPRAGRGVLVLLLLTALGATGVVGREAAATHSVHGLERTVLCLSVAIVLWAILAAGKPMVVELLGSRLTVRHRGRLDVFDLADPFAKVAVHGVPASPRWKLVLTTLDGREVVVGARTVDAPALDLALQHARVQAARTLAGRQERFNR